MGSKATPARYILKGINKPLIRNKLVEVSKFYFAQ